MNNGTSARRFSVTALTVFASILCFECTAARPAPPPATPTPATSATSATPATPARSRTEIEAAHKTAYQRATANALGRDFEGAIRELEPFARETDARKDVPLAYWIHNQLTWLRWGLGDLRGALRETDLGKAALNRSTLGAEEIASMRLHELWDRAYLLLDLHEEGAADKAFAAYESLATARNDHDGLAVLQAFFAARRKKNADAVTAAKKVDVEKDTDLQDLYVIALALDLSDSKAGASVRQRICKGSDYLMKPLILAQMEREGFKCP